MVVEWPTHVCQLLTFACLSSKSLTLSRRPVAKLHHLTFFAKPTRRHFDGPKAGSDATLETLLCECKEPLLCRNYEPPDGFGQEVTVASEAEIPSLGRPRTLKAMHLPGIKACQLQ